MKRLVLCVALLAATVAGAQERKSVFHDPQDGQLDLSEWLLDRKGFLPMPIIITEPAVGFGLGVAPVFFRQSLREQAEGAKGGHIIPPDVFGFAMAATENGTKFFGGGGQFTFLDDRWRYRGGVAKADVNLDFYGIGGALGTGEQKIGYNLDGIMSLQQGMLRLGETSHFLSLRWLYFDLKNRFEAEHPEPVLPNRTTRMRSSGLGPSWELDTRDNIFTPSRGIHAGIDASFYAPGIGSDTKFQTYRGHAFVWHPIGRELVLAGRADARAARGDVPFYQLPFIDMRGIPAARYQDRNVAVAEAELRWNITERWALVGFGGAGRVWGTLQKFGDADAQGALGAGVRYLVARRLGIYAGVDVARGPDGNAFYIQMGSAWR